MGRQSATIVHFFLYLWWTKETGSRGITITASRTRTERTHKIGRRFSILSRDSREPKVQVLDWGGVSGIAEKIKLHID